jgi:hypothetical protein
MKRLLHNLMWDMFAIPLLLIGAIFAPHKEHERAEDL